MNRPALDAAIRRSVLTKAQARVARFLLTLQTQNKGAPLYPSVYKTAKKLDLTHSTVRLAFARLVEFKVLRLIGAENGGSMPRVYALTERAVYGLPTKDKKRRNPTEISGVKRSSLKSVGSTPPNSVGITKGEPTACAKGINSNVVRLVSRKDAA